MADTPRPPKRRLAISEEQRRLLRQKHKDEPRLSQKQLREWFNTEFERHIDQSHVSKILSHRYDRIDNESSIHVKSRASQVQHPDLDNALFEWVTGMGSKVPLTGDLIKTKAARLWEIMPQYRDYPTAPAFSNGWLDSFRRRRGVKAFLQHGEAGSVNTIEAEPRLQEIRETCALFARRDIYNMDETGIFWKMVPRRGLSIAPIAGRKQDKARITGVFTVNADGSDKCKIWVIGTAETPRAFTKAKVKTTSLPCEWRANETAWMATYIMLDWFMQFDAYVAPRYVLLLLDNFSAHEAAFRIFQQEAGGVSQPFKHIRVEFLPPNTTSRFQPLDQGIIAAWKAHYKRRWLQYMIQEVEAGRDPQKTTHVLNAVRWAASAWDAVEPSTIEHCWMHSTLLGLDAAFEDTPGVAADEASTVRLHSEIQELVNIVVPDAADRMALSFFLNPEEEIIEDTPDDYLQHVAATFSPTTRDAESDEDEDAGTQRLVSTDEVIQALSTIQIYEEQQQNSHLLLQTECRKQERRLRAEQWQKAFNRVKQASLDLYWTPL